MKFVVGVGIVLKYLDNIKELKYEYKDTNSFRIKILAIILGLEQLKYKCRVLVYTNDFFIAFKFNEMVNKYKNDSEYIKQLKVLEKNLDLWLLLIEKLKYHEVCFKYYSEGNFDKFFCQARSLSRQAVFRPKADMPLIDLQSEKNIVNNNCDNFILYN